jgi:hypothetical protein
MPSNIYFFNPLFELELGNLPTERISDSAIEMTPLFSLLGNSEDRIICDVELPEEYTKYLSESGIDHAGFDPQTKPQTGVAWGWNQQSKNRLLKFDSVCNHPDLCVIKLVNSRKWCAEFNHKTDTGVPGSRFCQTQEAFDRARALLDDKFPLVAKPNFGTAGHGFVKILTPIGAKGFLPLQNINTGITLEPWCDRVADLSSSCLINADKSINNLRHYQCIVNAHGAFSGVMIGGRNLFLEKYHDALTDAATQAATALAAAGYFGPVSFDSFVYRDSSTQNDKLASIIEINARYSMSSIAFAVQEKIGKDRMGRFLFVSRRNLKLPDSYHHLSALFPDLYDPKSRVGILPLSPLRIKHPHRTEWSQPARSAFFIAGRN